MLVPPLPYPQVIGRYEVAARLGTGGMGAVYRGRDPRIDRPVAIKVLQRGDEALRRRFLKEAQAAGSLAHPNIVTIYDYGEHDEQPFIVMELIDGPTLAELIRQGPLRVGRALDIIDALCAGLHYAHERDIVHRDVKPANVMIGADGVVKIVDFGIARLGATALTLSGAMVGTPNYMSPEQVEGRPVDRRSDIFAVGLVLYEALTGRRAFEGESTAQVLHAILTGGPVPLRTLAPALDPELDRIVETAIKKAPGDRYQRLPDMKQDLAGVRLRLARSSAEGNAPTTLVLATPAPRSGPAQSREFGRQPLGRPQPEQAHAISAGLEAARRKLAAGEFHGAIRAASEVLGLDAANVEAHDLTRRGLDALETERRRQEEAQLRRQQAQESEPLRQAREVEEEHRRQERERRRRIEPERRAGAAERWREAVHRLQRVTVAALQAMAKWPAAIAGLLRGSLLARVVAAALAAGVLAIGFRLPAGGTAGESHPTVAAGPASSSMESPPTRSTENVQDMGLLVINALPWGEVLEVKDSDGTPVQLRERPFTPLALSVPSGSYQVAVKDPASGATRVLTVRVEPNGSGRADVTFDKIDASDYFRRAGFEELR